MQATLHISLGPSPICASAVSAPSYTRAMSEAVATLTFDGWLLDERGRNRRTEFVGGRAYLMAGGTERHDLLAGLLYEAIAPVARAQGCRPFFGNRVLRTVGGSAYYPDFMVVCRPAEDRLYEVDPTLVIEVLSPSTADTDRREKAVAFAQGDALTTLLLADPLFPRIESARMVEGRIVGWETFGPGDTIDTGYGVLSLDDLYAELEAVATT